MAHKNTQKPRKDAEFNIKERLWMKISTKKELKYQPWYNDEGYQPVNPNLINITVLQWVKIGRPRTETFIMVWHRPIRKLKFFAFSIFNDKDGMKILENTFMDTIYVPKRMIQSFSYCEKIMFSVEMKTKCFYLTRNIPKKIIFAKRMGLWFIDYKL